jgi:hypothetical protein
MKLRLNLVGPQVRKWRDYRGWSQETMAQKSQLQGWSITRHSLAKLELFWQKYYGWTCGIYTRGRCP